MFAYMFWHEAHHRGQILMLAHQLDYRLPDKAAYGIWQWEKRWKQAGLTNRPRGSPDRIRSGRRLLNVVDPFPTPGNVG